MCGVPSLRVAPTGVMLKRNLRFLRVWGWIPMPGEVDAGGHAFGEPLPCVDGVPRWEAPGAHACAPYIACGGYTSAVVMPVLLGVVFSG